MHGHMIHNVRAVVINITRDGMLHVAPTRIGLVAQLEAQQAFKLMDYQQRNLRVAGSFSIWGQDASSNPAEPATTCADLDEGAIRLRQKKRGDPLRQYELSFLRSCVGKRVSAVEDPVPLIRWQSHVRQERKG